MLFLPATERRSRYNLSLKQVICLWLFVVLGSGVVFALRANLSTFAVSDTTPPTVPGKPVAITPATDSTPMWIWEKSTDGESGLDPVRPYHVRWSDDPTFTTEQGATSGTESYTHEFSKPLAEGVWYFRVKAADAAGNHSEYSEVASVLIDTTPPTVPGKPQTLSPTKEKSATWTWSASTDINGLHPEHPYEILWCYEFADCRNIKGQEYSKESSLAQTLDSEGHWYAKVRSIDQFGNVSSWSDTGEVIADWEPPTAPGKPTTSSFFWDTTPTWSWSSSDDKGGINHYLVTWKKSDADTIYTATTNTNSFTHTKSLETGEWQIVVQAIDVVGNTSIHSPYGSAFVIALPVESGD